MTHAIPAATPTPAVNLIRALGGVGIICALLIVFSYQLTLPTITRKKLEYLQEAVYRTLPNAKTSVAFVLNGAGEMVPDEDGAGTGEVFYAGYNSGGDLVGVAFQSQGQGFQDVIHMLFGYDPKAQTIIGFQVLESRETPGLGDKIEKDAHFQANFTALDVSLDEGGMLRHGVELVPAGSTTEAWQIDAISGATISSRAIARILAENAKQWVPVLNRNQKVFQEYRP